MKDLKNKYKGQTCYIVGRGESIRELKKEHFKEGVVIAINYAINKVNELNLDNDVYSMQKDGYHKSIVANQLIEVDCVYPDCNNCNLRTVNPYPATLLVHKHESEKCFDTYKPRYVFDNIELGLKPTDFSALSCIKLAGYMGCSKLVFFCFDSLIGKYTGVDTKTDIVKENINYKHQIDIQRGYLKNIDHKYIIPKKEIEEKYVNRCNTKGDINEHIYTLRQYALECNHITELGVWKINSTWGLLAGYPKKMISIDKTDPKEYGSNINQVYDIVKPIIDFKFIQASTLDIEIEETDLLFIDTWHVYRQLKAELTLHGNKARKYIIMHDTQTYGWHNSGGGGFGLKKAIDEFMEENKHWVVDKIFTNNNGLTILKRVI